jgi:hypothetical protein
MRGFSARDGVRSRLSLWKRVGGGAHAFPGRAIVFVFRGLARPAVCAGSGGITVGTTRGGIAVVSRLDVALFLVLRGGAAAGAAACASSLACGDASVEAVTGTWENVAGGCAGPAGWAAVTGGGGSSELAGCEVVTSGDSPKLPGWAAEASGSNPRPIGSETGGIVRDAGGAQLGPAVTGSGGQPGPAVTGNGGQLGPAVTGRPTGVSGAERTGANVAAISWIAVCSTELMFSTMLVEETAFDWNTSPSSPGLKMRIESDVLHDEQSLSSGLTGGLRLVSSAQFQFQFQIQAGVADGETELVPRELSEQFQFQFQTQVAGGVG